jgi:hypothetical protein
VEQGYSGTPGRTGTGGGGGAVSPGFLNELLRLLVRLLNQLVSRSTDLASRGGEQVKAEWDNQQGGQQIRSRLEDQKHQISQRMVPVQTALRETAQQLRKQDQTTMGGYADRAAERVERVSGYVRETDVDQMVDEARGFARRRPAIFLGSAATLGFLAARFMKSSSQQAVSAGGGSNATEGGVPSQGVREPAVVHRGIAEGLAAEPAAPAGGQPLEDRYAQVERTEPPRSY